MPGVSGVPGAGGGNYTTVPDDGAAEVKEVRRVVLDGPAIEQEDSSVRANVAPKPPPRRRKIVC